MEGSKGVLFGTDRGEKIKFGPAGRRKGGGGYLNRVEELFEPSGAGG